MFPWGSNVCLCLSMFFFFFSQYHLSGPGEAASERRQRCYFKPLYNPGSLILGQFRCHLIELWVRILWTKTKKKIPCLKDRILQE